MKKLLLIPLLLLASKSYSDTRWTTPFVLLYTTNTFQNTQTFVSSVTFLQPITVPSCNGCGGGSGGSDNLGSHVSTMILTAPFGIVTTSSVTARYGYFGASVTANGTFSSTSGVIVGPSSMTDVLVLTGSKGATNPALVFNGAGSANTTGLYAPGADTIGFSDLGVLVFSLQSGALVINSGSKISVPSGTRAAPSYSNTANALLGDYFDPSGSPVNTMRVAGNVEIQRWNARGSVFGSQSAQGGVLISTIDGAPATYILKVASGIARGLTLLEIWRDSTTFSNNIVIFSSPIITSAITSSGPIVCVSSIAAFGEITSTNGFIGGGSTFTSLNVYGPSAFNSTMTVNSALNITNASTMALTNTSLQLFTTGVNKYSLLTSSVTNIGTQYLLAITTNGVITSSGTAPLLTTCGTGPTVVGNSKRMSVTVGATATGCTITFVPPFLNKPICWVDEETGSVVNAFNKTITNTTITISQVGLGGDIVNIGCDGVGE